MLHLRPTRGHLPLAGLTSQQVQAALQRQATGPLADKPCSVQRMRDVLRSALKHALRCGVVAHNAAELAEPPRYARPEVRPFTPEEARSFLVTIRGERLEALYAVALALGLRQGEALGLTWDDVDLFGGTIHVRRQLQRVGRQLRRCDLKTTHSRRTLLPPPTLLELLVVHRERQWAKRLRAGRAGASPSPTSSSRRRSARHCSPALW